MNKEVLIIGAGLSGRGMLGELFYQDGYHITFADCDSQLVQELKEQGYYDVKKTNLESCQSQITRVQGFSILDTVQDEEAYIEKIANAHLICTALKPDAFDDVIDHLVYGIKVRMKRKNRGIVYVTLGANYVGLYEYFDKHIQAQLNDEEKSYYHTYVSLIMSIVNRKNLKPMDIEEPTTPYAIIGDDKPVLRVEAKKGLKQLEQIPSFFQLEYNLSAAMAVKIWSGNIVQCSLAFVALYKGMKTSREAANDDYCSRLAYHAALEAYSGVFQAYHVDENYHEIRAKQAVEIFKNKVFADDLHRIAREPIRKIAYNDRFIGPARLCIKYGRLPYFITKCLAYVFLLDLDTDSDFHTIQQAIHSIGIRKTIEEYCGLQEDKQDENILIELIENAYWDILGDSFT